MRVLLVSANREDISMVALPLGLAYVAEAAKAAGHDVRLIDLARFEDPLDALKVRLKEFDPKVIGVSVRNVDDQSRLNTRFLLDQARDAVAICRRESAAPIVLGGAGFSIFPGQILEYLGADAGIRGEGEEIFPAYLEALQTGGEPSLPGLYLKGAGLTAPRAFIQDLDAMPWQNAHEWFDRTGCGPDTWMPIQTRRGCPLNCAYCSTPAIEGRRIRRRSPAAVAKAVAGMMEDGIERFYFTDNTFNLPPSYALELCRELAALPDTPSWRCILYPGRLSAELVSAMKDAGCTELSLGFESGSTETLSTLNKHFSKDEVRDAARYLGDAGIQRSGFLLLGAPGETEATVEESLRFADSLDLEMVKATVGIRIYPDTPLAATAEAKGLIPPGDDLLQPRFYLEPGLEDRLPAMVAQWVAAHPTWVG
ncbi:MAG: radical SAM protein [Acidobacteriota bacterium]